MKRAILCLLKERCFVEAWEYMVIVFEKENDEFGKHGVGREASTSRDIRPSIDHIFARECGRSWEWSEVVEIVHCRTFKAWKDVAL